MKVTTWNVNGVRARSEQLSEWIATEQPDVLCLQEIKASPEAVPAALASLDGYTCRWHGHKGYSGVALLLRQATFGAGPQPFVHPPFDVEHRALAVEVDRTIICSLYVPNGGKDFAAKLAFLEGLDAWVAEGLARGARFVLCGDLNIAREERDVHPRLRDPEQIGQTARERALFAEFLGRGLVDVARHFEPENDALFTWWAPWRKMRERNMGWRLDYVLVSPSLVPQLLACSSRRDFGTSDHGPVTVELELPVTKVSATSDGTPPLPQGQLALTL